jgi:Holliday junction resolvase RusA-like endonuclease
VSVAIYFVVPGQPVGKGRPRASSQGGYVRMYTPAKTVTYEQQIARQATFAMNGMELLTTAINMRIVAFYGIPPSWSKRKQMQALNGELFPGKPDADNVAKAVLDACHVVYLDDKQVTRLLVEKEYSFEPRIEVYIHERLK